MKKFYLLLLVFPLLGAGARAQISLVKKMNLYDFFAPVNGKLLFFGNDGTNAGDYELWSTDGTAAGTQLVRDIDNATSSSIPQQAIWDGTEKSYRPIVY